MLIDFFQAVRQAKVPCSVREYLDLVEAVKAHVAFADLDGFYALARLCCGSVMRQRSASGAICVVSVCSGGQLLYLSRAGVVKPSPAPAVPASTSTSKRSTCSRITCAS